MRSECEDTKPKALASLSMDQLITCLQYALERMKVPNVSHTTPQCNLTREVILTVPYSVKNYLDKLLLHGLAKLVILSFCTVW